MAWSRAGPRSKLYRKGHGPGQNSVGASVETSRKKAVCTGGWTGVWRLRASVCSRPSGNQHSHGGRLGLRTSGLTRTVLLYSEYSRCLQEATTDVTQIDLQPESHWRRPSCPPCPCSIVTARPDLPPPPLPPANLKDHNTDNLNGRGSGTWTEQEASQLPGPAQGREVESSADAYLCSLFLLSCGLLRGRRGQEEKATETPVIVRGPNFRFWFLVQKMDNIHIGSTDLKTLGE